MRGRDVVAVYGSPLVRAQESAAEIAAVLGLQHGELEGVEELHVGVHEGVHDDTVGPVAEQVFGAWWRDNDLSGGFEGGETGLQIAARMRDALDLVADEHARRDHGRGVARRARWPSASSRCAGSTAAFVASHLLTNCDVVELERTGGAWTCTSWAGERPPVRSDVD